MDACDNDGPGASASGGVEEGFVELTLMAVTCDNISLFHCGASFCYQGDNTTLIGIRTELKYLKISSK